MKTARAFVLSVAALAAGAALAQTKGAARPAASAAQTVKIAYLDPLSGPFAALGQNLVRHFQLAAEAVSDKQLAGPGIRFEIVEVVSRLFDRSRRHRCGLSQVCGNESAQ